MRAKIIAYNEDADTFSIEIDDGIFDIDASEIQLSDFDDAETPFDIVNRFVELPDSTVSFIYGIG